MAKNLDDREIIILEQDTPSALKWLLVGTALGAGLALLLAPASGEDTRRRLLRRARRLRQAAEETVDDLQHRFDAFKAGDDEVDEESETGEEGGTGEEAAKGETSGKRADGPAGKKRGSLTSARAELERRLEAARARRREPAVEDEEPVA